MCLGGVFERDCFKFIISYMCIVYNWVFIFGFFTLFLLGFLYFGVIGVIREDKSIEGC